ncbi:MAG: RNA polymerase sigma factor [Planctomycetota bacterium]
MLENLEPFIDRVFRFALSLSRDRHLAEDLTQECFLRAVRSADQLKDELAIRSWLFRITLNLWKDYCKKKRISFHEGDWDVPGAGLPPLERLVQIETRQSAIELMQTLPDKQRTVLFLSAVEQLSNSEIASLLNTNENAVKSSLSIARKRMRELRARQKRSRKLKNEVK